MKKSALLVTLAFALILSSCSDKKEKTEKKENTTEVSNKTETTKVTPENYALAETEEIMAAKVKQIAKATGTNGVGVILHVKAGANPKEKVIMRLNFDTKYSWLILDLTEPATITMSEVGGRYQTAWVISDAHYNPFAFDKPGEYVLTEENVGSKYALVAFRTQANIEDPEDMKASDLAMDGLKVTQKDRGEFIAAHKWDKDDILAWRAKYQKIQKEKNISTDDMFGKKGERTLENHNVGTAFGWGGFTPEQAVYPIYYPKTSNPQTFTIKDVPVKAFWSITVYDEDGFVATDTYNINSQFAKKNKDGSVTIHFGGDPKADNYMDIFDNWNFAFRLYQPTEAYFDGSWKKPELIEVK
jgi:hypothetical protein